MTFVAWPPFEVCSCMWDNCWVISLLPEFTHFYIKDSILCNWLCNMLVLLITLQLFKCTCNSCMAPFIKLIVHSVAQYYQSVCSSDNWAVLSSIKSCSELDWIRWTLIISRISFPNDCCRSYLESVKNHPYLIYLRSLKMTGCCACPTADGDDVILRSEGEGQVGVASSNWVSGVI